MMNKQEVINQLESKDLREAIHWLNGSPLSIAFSTSMGQEDQVLTYLLTANESTARIFTLDTGRLFPEAYDLIAKTESRYNTSIQIVFPNQENVQSYVSEEGINGFFTSVESRKRCCSARKIQPLKRALQGVDVWITGLRADQSQNRSNMAVANWDENFGVVKYNPLIHWTYDQVIACIKENNIPYNPLHDKGYISIGCAPCTKAIQPGEDPRSGRWWWESSKKECGLHQ